jgi:chitin disaccharide deacetylase
MTATVHRAEPETPGAIHGLICPATSPDTVTMHPKEAHHAGRLIVNADDWGRDRDTTDRTRDCLVLGTVSSVSAMVFMEDSERAAAMARERGIDAGLHLNFTTPFSSPDCPARFAEHQRKLATYLRRHPLARVVFHPGLVASFEYLVTAQRDEFQRLYGTAPERLDGHHHMHLCANVLFGGLLPPGTIVRRNFSFQRGEKNWTNRFYRRLQDRRLGRRYCLADFLFSLAPLEPRDRLQRIFSLAREFVVEVETHPINPEEYQFLTRGEVFRWARDIPIATSFAVPVRNAR